VIEKICVTRHVALYDYLVSECIIPEGTIRLNRATPDDIRGFHVYGKLPYCLAAHCARYTELELRVPMNMRGRELSLEQIASLVKRPRTYKVIEIQGV